MFSSPNFFLGLMRVAASLLWRDPVTNDSKTPPKPPKRPRKPMLMYTVGPIPDHIHSIIRTSWYKQGRPVEIDEFQIMECDEATNAFHWMVGRALKQGADVSVLTTYEAEELGVPTPH